MSISEICSTLFYKVTKCLNFVNATVQKNNSKRDMSFLQCLYLCACSFHKFFFLFLIQSKYTSFYYKMTLWRQVINNMKCPINSRLMLSNRAFWKEVKKIYLATFIIRSQFRQKKLILSKCIINTMIVASIIYPRTSFSFLTSQIVCKIITIASCFDCVF